MVAGISSQVFYPQRLRPALLDALAGSGARVIELFAARFHFDYTDRQILYAGTARAVDGGRLLFTAYCAFAEPGGERQVPAD
jgi:hypothetical protein